jgi:hypothetical protein
MNEQRDLHLLLVSELQRTSDLLGRLTEAALSRDLPTPSRLPGAQRGA